MVSLSARRPPAVLCGTRSGPPVGWGSGGQISVPCPVQRLVSQVCRHWSLRSWWSKEQRGFHLCQGGCSSNAPSAPASQGSCCNHWHPIQIQGFVRYFGCPAFSRPQHIATCCWLQVPEREKWSNSIWSSWANCGRAAGTCLQFQEFS